MKFTHTHVPTGKPCTIVSLHAGDTAVIDYGDGQAWPIKRVHRSDLVPIEDPRQTRTDVLLRRWHGKPGEYPALHGVLCMPHGLSGDDWKLAESVFDGMRIALRLDELMQAARNPQN